MNLSTEKKQNTKSELSENLDFLRKASLFSRFPLEALRVIAYLCVRVDFAKGDFLFQQGDDEGQAFLLLVGKLEAARSTENKPIRWEVGGGELLGGLSLFGSMARQFSLQAITDITVLTIDRETFGKGISPFPEHQKWLLSALLHAVHDWDAHCLQGLEQACPACIKRIGLTLL